MNDKNKELMLDDTPGCTLSSSSDIVSSMTAASFLCSSLVGVSSEQQNYPMSEERESNQTDITTSSSRVSYSCDHNQSTPRFSNSSTLFGMNTDDEDEGCEYRDEHFKQQKRGSCGSIELHQEEIFTSNENDKVDEQQQQQQEQHLPPKKRHRLSSSRSFSPSVSCETTAHKRMLTAPIISPVMSNNPATTESDSDNNDDGGCDTQRQNLDNYWSNRKSIGFTLSMFNTQTTNRRFSSDLVNGKNNNNSSSANFS